MARKRTPKAPEKTQDDTFGPMSFGDIGAEADATAAAEKAKPAEPTVAELLAKIEVMNTRMDRREQELISSIQTPVAIPAAPVVVAPIDYSKLPDPVVDAAGFAAGLTAMVQAQFDARMANENTSRQVAQTREQKLTNLWEDFSNAYPEIAGDTENMELIAMKVSNKAKRQGIDLDRYMFGTPQKFMDDMAKSYEQVFGDATGDPEPTPRKRVAADTDEPNRTSVFGGIESGGRPSNPVTAGVTDMIKDMHLIQQKSGFF